VTTAARHPRLRGLLGRVLPAPVRRWLRPSRVPALAGCSVLDGPVPAALSRGWQEAVVAQRQRDAFGDLLRQLREGRPREDFLALAHAVAATHAECPSLIEVGCGSGWNAEVLARLAPQPLAWYVGLDYSTSMVSSGQADHPDGRFVVGDATQLPLRDACCDILLSGTVLMHLLGWRQAVQEARRTTRRWCIFHTVPVCPAHPTTRLRKLAYGVPVVELVFNTAELTAQFSACDLQVRDTFPSVPHPYLEAVLGQPVSAFTYLCEVRPVCKHPV